MINSRCGLASGLLQSVSNSVSASPVEYIFQDIPEEFKLETNAGEPLTVEKKAASIISMFCDGTFAGSAVCAAARHQRHRHQNISGVSFASATVFR